MGLFGRKKQEKKLTKNPQDKTLDDWMDDLVEIYIDEDAREAGISKEEYKKKAKLQQQQDKKDYYSNLHEIYGGLTRVQLAQTLQYLIKYERLLDISTNDLDAFGETKELLLTSLNNPTWHTSDYTDNCPLYIDQDIKYVTLLLNQK